MQRSNFLPSRSSEKEGAIEIFRERKQRARLWKDVVSRPGLETLLSFSNARRFANYNKEERERRVAERNHRENGTARVVSL